MCRSDWWASAAGVLALLVGLAVATVAGLAVTVLLVGGVGATGDERQFVVVEDPEGLLRQGEGLAHGAPPCGHPWTDVATACSPAQVDIGCLLRVPATG